MREQLQAGLAASSASRVRDRAEEVSARVRQSVQPVVLETQNTNNASLDAIQALSARLDGMSNRVDAVEQGRQPMPVHLLYMAETERVPRLSPQVGVFPMSLLGVILAMMVRARMMKKKKNN